MTTLSFPWPDKAITPHVKGHWRAKAAATKKQREAAYWIARAANVQCDPKAILRIEYFPPDNRARDLHNMPLRIKGLIDGIADAMGCDDRGFCVYFPPIFSEVVKGGAIKVNIGEVML